MILANLAFALAILALIAFLWAGEAFASFFTSLATFLAAANYLRRAFFLLGSVAERYFFSIFETLLWAALGDTST